MIRKLNFSRALSLFIFLAITSRAVAGDACTTTIPPGSVFNATWTAANSPYCVIGDLSMSLVTIEAGVIILIDGPYAIDIQTTIQVAGTEDQPVSFAAKDPAVSLWHGLKFQDTQPGSSLVNFTIRDSSESGISLINTSSLTFEKCRISNNFSQSYGGAINADGVNGDLNIIDCHFSDNTSGLHGGALSVLMNSGLLSIVGSTFDNNTANPARATGNIVGGALWFRGGDAVILNSQFYGNRSNARCTSSFDCNVTGRGGAIYVGGEGVMSVTNSLFRDNHVDALNQGNCFFGGSSLGYGAGIYVNSSDVTLSNTIMACNINTATNCGRVLRGGGVFVNGGSATFVDSTIARNANATGAYRAAGTMDIDSSIIFYNNADGAQLGGHESGAVNYSAVQNWAGDGVGNTLFNPGFAGPGCDPIDFPLQAFPPIDSGNPATMDSCFRPSQFTAAHDMGAYGGPGACAGDWDFDGFRDETDNCRFIPNPGQRDTDGDSIGNMCDADIATPNNCVVNVADLGTMRAAFFSTPSATNWNPDADLNGDDVVNITDLGLLKRVFFFAPGPSGIVPNNCENQ